jgi:hypothetical protein
MWRASFSANLTASGADGTKNCQGLLDYMSNQWKMDNRALSRVIILFWWIFKMRVNPGETMTRLCTHAHIYNG